MDNSRSLEALYQDGTGMVSLPKKSYKASIEGYDGFDDILSANLAKSEENLAFLDTFQMIEAKNAADKVKMCRKLAANYGKRSGMPAGAATSVESLCNIMSLEEAAKAEAAGVNTGNEKAQTPETETKKLGFFKTVFKAIKEFFDKIWNVFMGLIGKIKGLFNKKQAGAADGTKDVDLNANASANGETAANETASDMKNRKANTKTKLNLDYDVFVDITKFNPAGIKKFAQSYTKTSSTVNSFASKLRTAGKLKTVDGKTEDQSVANGRKNELMEKEGKALIETIDATTSIVKGVADRRTSLAARADAKSIDAALKAASKDLTFEVGSDNAYTVLGSLFGVTRDKQLEKDAEAFKKSNGRNASNYLLDFNTRKAKMAGYVVKAISEIPNELKGPHTAMVKVCTEFENSINSYVSGIDKGNASEFYTTLTVLASALKVCTKMEQVVVKAVASMIKIVK